MRKTRKKTGVNRRLLLSLITLAACLLPLAAWAGDKDMKDPSSVVVTVFKDPGFAFGGAEVSVAAVPAEGEKPSKPQRTKTDARGECSFRVPGKKATYVVRASAPGFQAEQKQVTVAGSSERADVYLTLKPEAAAK